MTRYLPTVPPDCRASRISTALISIVAVTNDSRPRLWCRQNKRFIHLCQGNVSAHHSRKFVSTTSASARAETYIKKNICHSVRHCLYHCPKRTPDLCLFVKLGRYRIQRNKNGGIGPVATPLALDLGFGVDWDREGDKALMYK